MESRTILVVDPATNTKVTLNTDATTFGELKAALASSGANIDTTDKDWLEAITRSTPVGDSSLLPTNVTYKGQTTNNLVYMLSNTNKKTKSGSRAKSKYNRNDLYAEVVKYNLASTIRAKYGKAYTAVPNDSLALEIELAIHKETEEFDGVAELKKEIAATATVTTNNDDYDTLKANYNKLVLEIAKFKLATDSLITDDIIAEAKKSDIVDIDFTNDELNELMRR